MQIFSLLFIIMIFSNNTNAQQIIPLYAKQIPNSKPFAEKEKNETDDGRIIISNVTQPTLTIFKPANYSSQHAAVIICPGGGYAILSASAEGSDIAKVLNNWGITAFVLKYRLPDDSIMQDKSIGPLQDAQRAIQLVREHAKEWNIDPNKIGIMGFSAGGHLASTASTHFNDGVIENPNHISLRPDFSVLIYPVISFTDSLAHTGSRDNLIGTHPSQEMIRKYSSELNVEDSTPPAFIVHAGDDDVVKVNNSVAYYEALLKHHVFSQLIIYPHGGHGFGLNNQSTTDKWTDHLKNWIKENKFL